MMPPESMTRVDWFPTIRSIQRDEPLLKQIQTHGIDSSKYTPWVSFSLLTNLSQKGLEWIEQIKKHKWQTRVPTNKAGGLLSHLAKKVWRNDIWGDRTISSCPTHHEEQDSRDIDKHSLVSNGFVLGIAQLKDDLKNSIVQVQEKSKLFWQDL